LLRVKIIAFGKCKEPYLRQGCAEYEKRLRTALQLEIIELPPAPLPENPSFAQIAAALAAEEKAALPALQALPRGARLAALCVEGKTQSSEQFSAWLAAAAMQSGAAALLIGSSYGLSEGLKARADLRLSFSAMTFPHQLARLMLLEQLYRAAQIAGGGKYHK
jgi:23S rRNA (pseudouridine1915-N3)-methyltransferase